MFAREAYRTILVTYKDLSMDEFEDLKASHGDFEEDEQKMAALENNLTAVCVFGLQDPLRDTIRGSVEQVEAAGITVIMCTGDNLETAKAISKNAGILNAKDLDKMNN